MLGSSCCAESPPPDFVFMTWHPSQNHETEASHLAAATGPLDLLYLDSPALTRQIRHRHFTKYCKTSRLVAMQHLGEIWLQLCCAGGDRYPNNPCVLRLLSSMSCSKTEPDTQCQQHTVLAGTASVLQQAHQRLFVRERRLGNSPVNKQLFALTQTRVNTKLLQAQSTYFCTMGQNTLLQS